MSASTFLRPGRNLRWGVLLFALIALLAPISAFARNYHLQRFNDALVIHEDGRVIVSEELTFVFEGSFKGIHRRIPVEYPVRGGSNYTLFIDNVDVTDDAGSPLKFKQQYKGDQLVLEIYVPGAVDATRTIRIRYVVLNGIRYFEDHDELYWNVTGNDWLVDIDRASALAVLPDSAIGSIRAQAFEGAYGSATPSVSQVNGAQVSFESAHPLPPRGGMTVDVYVPKGIIHQPNVITRGIWFLRSNLVLLLPLLSFLVMGGMWYYKGRDPDPGLSVAPLYEAPEGMTPAEVGTLIDDTVDPRDITSTLVDLAVRGYLKIEEVNEKVLFFNNKDFVFHLMKPQGEWGTIARHENEILTNMFMTSSTECRLSDLKNRFYLAIPSIKKEIIEELKDKTMYRVDPDTANGYRVVGILLIVAPIVLAQVTGFYQFFRAPVMAVIAAAISLVIVYLFGRNMTAKTMKGMRAVVGIQGFREFMSRVDGDRLRKFPPETFEKCLPFAMALGVEKHWASAFQGIIKDPPSWYVSQYPMGTGWNTMMFTNSMNNMSSSTYEAFTSAPRASSSGSGFGGGGGGGFSGGGFGGGGGDAF
jgi:Predicted membrane protein (DUF2207)